MDEKAPVHQNQNVREFVSLEAKFGHLKKSELASTVIRLADGKDYYRIVGAVEATFYGTSTKYCLLYQGKYVEDKYWFLILTASYRKAIRYCDSGIRVVEGTQRNSVSRTRMGYSDLELVNL